MADNNEFAILHTKLEQVLELQAEIKEELKNNKQWSEDHINELKQKITKNEQDIRLLELKLSNLETLHKADVERVNKRWDIPNKIMMTVLGSGIGILLTALFSLILK